MLSRSILSLSRRTPLVASRALRLTPTSFLTHIRNMQTISQAIVTDHEEIFQYYSAYRKAHLDGDVDKATRFANQLRWEVARHSAGEEIVVYPWVSQAVGFLTC